MDYPEIRINDEVALLEDTATQHFETGRPLLLRRGQIGTIVMTYDGRTFEVEFSSRDGYLYRLSPGNSPAGEAKYPDSALRVQVMQ